MAEFFEKVTEFFGKIGQFFSFIKQIIGVLGGILEYGGRLLGDLFEIISELASVNPFLMSILFLVGAAIIVIIIIAVWEAIT